MVTLINLDRLINRNIGLDSSVWQTVSETRLSGNRAADLYPDMVRDE